MTGERTIDFHTHAHPSAEAAIAFQRLWRPEQTARDGTPEALLAIMDRVGIQTAMIIPFVPVQLLYGRRVAAGGSPDEVRTEILENQLALNRWAVEAVAAHAGRFRCLVSIDPVFMDRESVEREVAHKLSHGACGIKIAPMFLGAPPDDERVEIVFELAERHGAFVLSQSGALGWEGAPGFGHPGFFEKPLREHPSVDLVLAHLGVGAEAKVADLCARYPNLYTDTSNRLSAVGTPGGWSPDEAAAWIRRIGVERVLFGTNYPLEDPIRYLEVMRALPLTEAERRKTLFENASRLLARVEAMGRGSD